MSPPSSAVETFASGLDAPDKPGHDGASASQGRSSAPHTFSSRYSRSHGEITFMKVSNSARLIAP